MENVKNDCLYCKYTPVAIKGVNSRDGFIITTLQCPKCRKVWRDYTGNEESPVLSIQRNTSSNSEKPEQITRNDTDE